MTDSEVVASIVAGDPAGLAEAYDLYAPGLHAYCRSMLREPADAADAVQDTFVIAASRLKDLRDPDRLRPWLYAVARNVCLRKLRQDKAAARYAPALGVDAAWGAVDPAHAANTAVATDPDDVAEPGAVGDRAEFAELRALVRDAAGGLTWRDREILRLRLWEELGLDEAGAVLGVSRGYAGALFNRAREQLTASIGALLVARSGRSDCAELRQILENWDGQLTILMRKRLSRHIEHCDVCAGRRRRELVPALLGLSPGAALAGAAGAEGLRQAGEHAGAQAAGHVAAHVAPHAAELTAALKTQTLAAAAAAKQAGLTAAGAKTLSASGVFGRGGFPKPVHHGTSWVAHATRSPAATAGTSAAAIAVATAVALALALPGGGPHGQIAGGVPGGSGTSPTPTHGGTGGGHPGGKHPGGGKPTTRPTPGSSGGAGGQPRTVSSALAYTSPGAPTSGAPPVSTSPSPPPTSSSPVPPPPPPAKPGTLTVSTGTVLLTPLLGESITLTAHGGTVHWSIAESSTLLGSLTASPASGTLAAGASTTVTITVEGLASLDTTLTVYPGGVPVHVLIGLL